MAPLVAEKTVTGRNEKPVTESGENAVSLDEQVWDAQFAGSLDVLEELFDEITADHEAGAHSPIQA